MRIIKLKDIIKDILDNKGVPTLIKYDDYFWKYSDAKKDYLRTSDDHPLFKVYTSLCSITNSDEEAIVYENEDDIEEIETYYDEDLEENIAKTFIDGRYVKQAYGSPFEQMLIDKINEIIKKYKELIK